MESLRSAGEVKVEEEQRVIEKIPEAHHALVIPGRRLRGVAPQGVRTSDHGVFEHVDGSAELTPYDTLLRLIHFSRLFTALSAPSSYTIGAASERIITDIEV